MSIWSGKKDTGPREFSDREVVRVLKALENHRGRGRATTLENFSRTLDMPSRQIRAILASYDGVRYVLHLREGLLYIAEYQDETEHTTRNLFAHASSLRNRALRREQFAKNLPRRQGYLLEPDDTDTDDEEEYE